MVYILVRSSVFLFCQGSMLLQRHTVNSHNPALPQDLKYVSQHGEHNTAAPCCHWELPALRAEGDGGGGGDSQLHQGVLCPAHHDALVEGGDRDQPRPPTE